MEHGAWRSHKVSMLSSQQQSDQSSDLMLQLEG